MDTEKRSLLISMALGDGYVQVRKRLNRGKYPYESRELAVTHGPQQEAYCRWKAKRVSWALGGRQINVHRYKSGPGNAYECFKFTVSHPYFKQIKNMLYVGNKKVITREVLDRLTDEGVAIWYMDDGSARKHINRHGWVSSVQTQIATQCTKLEAEEIQNWFAEKYSIDFNIRYDRGGNQYYMECNTEASRKFAKIVLPYIPECMAYKITHVSNLSSQERQLPISKCKECDAPIYELKRKHLCQACYARQYYPKVRARMGKDIVRPYGKRTVRSAV